MTIKLYIGAHKTATTHLQGILQSNREALHKHHIKLSTPDTIRETWMSSFLDYCNTENSHTLEYLRSELPSDKTWLIAEENFSGVSYDLQIYSGIYPHLERRLRSFKHIFESTEIEVFFSVRSYASYYRSSYLEVVRNKGYIPFSHFYNKSRFESNNWVSVIKQFVSVFPEQKITLWRYEDLKQILPEAINKITGLTIGDQLLSNYKVEITRPSISAKTIHILETLSSFNSQYESIKMIEHLNNKFPANNKNGYYQPFDNNIIMKYASDYNNDLQTIKKLYPCINFLS